jgi:hypothetical protein
MNVKAGVTRAWLVGSLAWVLYCAWQSDIACPLALVGIDIPSGPWCEFQNAEPFSYYGGLILKMAALPTAAWLVGAASYWVLIGFRGPVRPS